MDTADTIDHRKVPSLFDVFKSGGSSSSDTTSMFAGRNTESIYRTRSIIQANTLFTKKRPEDRFAPDSPHSNHWISRYGNRT